MVVLADDRLTGDDGEIGEEGLERGGPGFRTHGDDGLHGRRSAPFGLHLAARGLMQGRDVEIAHDGAVMEDFEALGAVGLGEHAEFGLVNGGEFVHGGEVFFLDGDDHALLGFADEDLPAFEVGGFERGVFQPHFTAGLAQHFACGRAEATRTAVGDELDEALLTRGEHEVGGLLFFNRVADLHGGLVFFVRVGGERCGGEGGTLEAVLAGATTGGDEQMAGLHFLGDVLDRDDAGGAAEHQGIVNEGVVKLDRAIDGGDAHAVAVVAHAAHHATHDAEGVDDVLRFDVFLFDVGRAKAEDVDGGDRLRAFASAEDVADHAAEAGVRTCVGLDGAGVVVRFDLEADGLVGIQTDEARVVFKGTEHEVGLVLADLLRHSADVGLEEAVHDFFLAVEGMLNLRAKDAVLAVLAPGLGDDFHFDVRGLAALVLVNLLHGEHVGA